MIIQVHNKYTGEDFDEDLRAVLRRSGCKDEKIAFILDESNVLDSGFLERMNTLLANGEVPGLFEGQYKFASIQGDALGGGPKFIIKKSGNLLMKRKLVVICLGRCGDNWSISDLEIGFLPLGDTG
jgi:hypothetical protein